MDLTQLANLGEFIGGVAVLVTLVYLAVQMRQSTSIQFKAAEMAKADSLQKAVTTWSAWRRMIADDGLSEIWLKALDDQELTPKETLRLRVMIAELTYSANAAYENARATGNVPMLDVPPAVVAREIGTSNVMRRAWSELSDDLRHYHLGGFADEVARRLETGGTR